MLKAIHAQESKRAASEKAKAVVEQLRSMKLKGAVQSCLFISRGIRSGGGRCIF